MCPNALEFLQVSNMEDCAYCQKSVRSKGAFECQSDGCRNIVHKDCKTGYAHITLDDKRTFVFCVSCVGKRVSQNIKLRDENHHLKTENVKLKTLLDKLSSLETEITDLKQRFDSLSQSVSSQQAPPSPPLLPH